MEKKKDEFFDMNKSFEILFQLLRAALGNKPVGPLPSDVDWKKVIDLLFDQGVAAIAVDGLHRICETDPNLELELDKEELEDMKYEWFGEVFSREEENHQQRRAIGTLVKLWAENGLRVYALKGLAFAQYYPVPEHRFSCDFDCNVRYADNPAGNRLPAWAFADQLAKESGIEVDDNQSKHSRFMVDGVSVENHRHVIGVNGSRKAKSFDAYLQGLLESSGESLLPDVKLYPPCWLFNALFCVAHAKTHFLVEDGITLKHVLDWALIKRDAQADVWYEQFERDIDRFGLRRFFDAFNGVADYVMGDSDALSDAQRLMLDDILASKDVRHFGSKFRARLNILRMLWANRWKYRYYSETNAFAIMWRYIYGYFFDKDVPGRN